MLMKCAIEYGDIVFAFAKRGNAETHHVESVEKVLAKTLRLDFGGEVAIRSDDDAEV